MATDSKISKRWICFCLQSRGKSAPQHFVLFLIDSGLIGHTNFWHWQIVLEKLSGLATAVWLEPVFQDGR
jgi:hypothetical protein